VAINSWLALSWTAADARASLLAASGWLIAQIYNIGAAMIVPEDCGHSGSDQHPVYDFLLETTPPRFPGPPPQQPH
jgi:hypothetical protein